MTKYILATYTEFTDNDGDHSVEAFEHEEISASTYAEALTKAQSIIREYAALRRFDPSQTLLEASLLEVTREENLTPLYKEERQKAYAAQQELDRERRAKSDRETYEKLKAQFEGVDKS